MRARRTAVVISLLAIAVLAPSGAWWVSGSREAMRRAEHLEDDAVEGLSRAVAEEAGRLQARLEVLRAAESRRPFYHYQNLTHDPRGATEGLSIIPSPLATGAPDPLVAAHFQIDPDGRVSLPTVNEDFPEFSTEDGFAMYCSLIADLEESLVLQPAAGGAVEPQVVGVGEEHRLANANQGHVVLLARSQWQQIERANQVYAQIAGREAGTGGPELSYIGRAAGSEEEVLIWVGPMGWHTIAVGSDSVLAALREVETPAGLLIQGFTVAADSVAADLATAASSVLFLPSPRQGEAGVTVAIGETGWVLEAGLAEALADASTAGTQVLSDFRRRFLVIFFAALVAAACVAAIVAQSDRLARQRTRFAAAAAHELKTPLSTLRLHAEMVAEGLGDRDRTATYAARIATEAGRLGRVVVNILDLSRLERRAALVKTEQVQLEPVVKSCVEGLRGSLEEAGLTVSLHLPDKLPKVACDPDVVCQILTNLLDNAERYTRGVEDRRVEVRLDQRRDRICLVVADNGPGVHEKLRRTLFKPFARGGAETDPSGLGLGLALGRSLARAQGGNLRLLGSTAGAVFELSFAPRMDRTAND